MTTLNYLDRALGGLRDMGLLPETTDEMPIVPLLNEISDLDEDKVVAIARTLSQASVFNDVVRKQVSAMEYGERYNAITEAFNSIRDDAKKMVDQIEDGRIDTFERLSNVWMKVTRGDISARFDGIKDTYIDVARDSKDQIERERMILEAYRDFRGALKQAEVLALEVLQKAEGELNVAKGRLQQSSDSIEAAAGQDRAALAKLEMARDERLRQLQTQEKRYQISKDLSDNLTIGYNTSEVIMARLMQTTTAKERVYSQAVSFFSTNETVLTAMSASFTGLHGLHESTQTLEAMKEGISQGLEDLASVGGKVQEAALEAGYGPTVRAESVKMLVDSVVGFQERQREIIEEMRIASTRNAEEIRTAVETAKQRLARLAERGQILLS